MSCRLKKPSNQTIQAVQRPRFPNPTQTTRRIDWSLSSDRHIPRGASLGLAEYALAADGAKGHPQNLASPARVIKIDGHSFIFTEVESAGRAFYLKLAEAFPGETQRPLIVLQTQAQIEKQVKDFVKEHQETV